MQYFSIDYLIVYAFLGITLFIGLRAGRGIKTIKEYAIGHGTYTTAILLFTFLATNNGGGQVFHGSSQTIKTELIRAFAAFGVIIQFLVPIALMVPHMQHFKEKECLTIGDVMGRLYGKYSQMITGVIGTLYSFYMIGMELFILGVISQSLLNIPAHWGIIIGGSIFVAYTAHGGIHAVTLTDIFQFLILFLVIPLIASVVLGECGGIKTVFSQIAPSELAIFSHEKFSYHLTLFLICSILPIALVSPPLFQRMLMGNQTSDLRNLCFLIAGFYPLYWITLILIGLGGSILVPYVEGSDIMPNIIKEILPVGFKGFAMAGLLAIVMSTLDSYLHTAGLILVHDVIDPLLKLKNVKINELRWARYSTFLVGGISIIIGLQATDAIKLVSGAVRIAVPLLLFPLYMGIVGLKPTRKAFYGALGITIPALVLLTYLLPEAQDHLVLPISFMVNAITFMTIHCVVNKGVVTVVRGGEEKGVKRWRFDSKLFLSTLHACMPTPANVMRYSTNRVEKYGAPAVLFGVFVAINFTYPYFMWNSEVSGIYNLMLILRLVGAFGCGLLIIREKWPKCLAPYFPIYWHTVIMYCLPFMSTFMLLLTHASIEWLINIAVGIILLLLIVDWLSAILLGILGMGAAFLFYHIYVGEIVLSLDFSSTYLLVYQILFGLLIGFLFARRKQLLYDNLDTKKQHAEEESDVHQSAYNAAYKERIDLIKALRDGKIEEMSTVMKRVQTLKAQIQEANAQKAAVNLAAWEDLIREVDDKLTPISMTIVGLDHRALDYLRLTEIGSIEIKALLSTLKSRFPDQKFTYLGSTTQPSLTCGIAQMKSLLKNTVQVLASKAATCVIAIDDTKLAYPAPNVKPGHVKRIPALRFSLSHNAQLIPPVAPVYDVQMSGSVIPATDCQNAIRLASNHRIIRAHYGYTDVDISQTMEHDCYTYVFPLALEDVRPRDMDSPEMELGATLVRADDHYPGAQEQEQEFFKALAQKASVKIENVQIALEMIKRYHGPVRRRTGEPFYLHPLAVARIVLDWTEDEATIIGALLHDTVEDTQMQLDQVEMKFGTEVSRIVDCVTHYESYPDSFYKLKLSETENVSMLLKTANRGALLVKVADRTHNMRTIDGHKSEEKKRTIAKETLNFFVPIALTLGIPAYAVDELQIRSEKVLEKG